MIAQANFATWRADNERLERFRSRNAAFAWMKAIVAAMEHAQKLPSGAAAQARPEPTMTFETGSTSRSADASWSSSRRPAERPPTRS